MWRKLSTDWKAILFASYTALVAYVTYNLTVMQHTDPPSPAVAMAKPAVTQKDGSTVLRSEPAVKVKPQAELPRGSKVKAVTRMVIQPNKAKNPDPLADEVDCGPVTIEVTTVETKEGERQVTLIDGGQLEEGLHTPKLELKWKEPQNAVGLIYDTERKITFLAQRRIGPVIAHAQIGPDTPMVGQKRGVAAGIGFLYPF